MFPHDLMRGGSSELTNIERFTNYEMVDTVGAAEIEAEQLHRPEKWRVQYLSLFNHGIDIAVVVHIRADKIQAKGSQIERCYKCNDEKTNA